jgi:hypothetical protein
MACWDRSGGAEHWIRHDEVTTRDTRLRIDNGRDIALMALIAFDSIYSIDSMDSVETLASLHVAHLFVCL